MSATQDAYAAITEQVTLSLTPSTEAYAGITEQVALSQTPTLDAYSGITENIVKSPFPSKTTYTQIIKNDLPIEYWELEEGASATEFVSSISGSVLVKRGTLTSGVTGYENASKAISGFGSTNYADWPSQPIISGSFTVDCMFTLSSLSVSNGQGIFGSRGTSDNSVGAWVSPSGALNVDVGNGSTWLANLSVANVITANIWYHLGVSVRTNGFSVYLDGSLLANSASYSGTPLLTNSTHLLRIGHLGSNFASNYPATNATIDEFAIYGTALEANRFVARTDTATAEAEIASATAGFSGWGIPL